MTPWKRRFPSETIIFRFYVNLRGCTLGLLIPSLIMAVFWYILYQNLPCYCCNSQTTKEATHDFCVVRSLLLCLFLCCCNDSCYLHLKWTKAAVRPELVQDPHVVKWHKEPANQPKTSESKKKQNNKTIKQTTNNNNNNSQQQQQPQPTTTNNNNNSQQQQQQPQPTTTNNNNNNNNNNQQWPTTANNNQQQQQQAANNNQQQQTTNNNQQQQQQQQPTTANNSQQQPTTTNNQQQPTTTNQQWPTTANNNQQQQTTNNNNKQPPLQKRGILVRCCGSWWLCRELAIARLRIHPWAAPWAHGTTPGCAVTSTRTTTVKISTSSVPNHLQGPPSNSKIIPYVSWRLHLGGFIFWQFWVQPLWMFGWKLWSRGRLFDAVP